MEDLNIQWTEQKDNNKFGEYFADVGDHYLIVQRKDVVDLSLKCMWCITDKEGNVINHGEEVVSVGGALVNSHPDPEYDVVELAKKSAEKEYYERLFVEQVIKDEVLCDESS